MTRSKGALLIHGLGGTQYDLGSLHKTLRRAGVETHSLTLPGHGAKPEDLIPIRAEDWLDAVTEEYYRLVCRYDTLHVIGMCLGALLAVELCKRVQHRKGKLVSLAAPVFIDGWSTPWYRGLRKLVYRIPGLAARMRVEEEEPYGIKNQLVRSIVKAKFERGENFHYRWVPLSCVREVDRLGTWVKRDLNTVVCPTLVIHANEDELTSARSAHLLNDAIPNSRLVLLDNSYHMVCVDNDRDWVTACILQFTDSDPTVASRPGRISATTAEGIASVLDAYRASLIKNEFETLFPLFSEDVVWHERGDNPVSGIYEGRGGLIELFSRLMDYSRNTFSIRKVGPSTPTGRSISLPLQFQVQTGTSLYEGSLTHILRLRNDKITRVISTPSAVASQDALWRRLAADSGSESEVDILDDATRTISVEALPDHFEAAVMAFRLAPRSAPAAVAIRVQALEQQARHGDAGSLDEGGASTRTQINYAAWSRLAGLPEEEAMRRYIALIRHLDSRA